MGLDSFMYKNKHGYLLKNGKISYKFDDYKSNKYGIGNTIDIKTQCLYLRKANAIHSWFVNNVQDGKDDCNEYDVSDDKIHELYNICKMILDMADGMTLTLPKKKQESEFYKGVAKEITFSSKNLKKMYDCGLFNYTFSNKKLKEYIVSNLPPCSGFFFGSTDVDGGYLDDIVKTVLMLDDLLKEYELEKKNKEYPYLTYQASW